MILICVLGAALLAGCVSDSSGFTKWTPGVFRSSIPHAPQLDGYVQAKSEAVEFRKYKVHPPEGVWDVVLDTGDPPISIRCASGKRSALLGDWYPEEGGADSAAVYGFTKGQERLIIFEGRSALTYEETRVKFMGETMINLYRYDAKGKGMGPGMPGVEPEYHVYPAK